MLLNEAHTSPNMMQIENANITNGEVSISFGARAIRRQLAAHSTTKNVISTAGMRVAKLFASWRSGRVSVRTTASG